LIEPGKVVKNQQSSAWVLVVAALSAACALVAVGATLFARSAAPQVFAALGLVFAIIAAAFSARAPRDRYTLIVLTLATAFWTAGLWVLWRAWRVLGGFYDHLRPNSAHEGVWRIIFQLISIPIIAGMLQILLVAILVWLNGISKRRAKRRLD
jgi:protein-S-isoprenylcysteine O-methyltransferase Ste14